MTVCRFTFPSNTLSGCLEATRPHSQWRNRAGLSPDFPVMPVMGTRGEDPYTVAPCTGSSRETKHPEIFLGISHVSAGRRDACSCGGVTLGLTELTFPVIVLS